jgi:hypothetical protein
VLVHVPPAGMPFTVVDPPIQIVVRPVIESDGIGLTVTIATVVVGPQGSVTV